MTETAADMSRTEINGVEFTGLYMRVGVIAATEELAAEAAIEHTGIERFEWIERGRAEFDEWEVTFERYAQGDE